MQRTTWVLLISLNEKISEFGSVFSPSFAQRFVGSVAQTALWDGQTLSAHNELVELVFEPPVFIELTVGQLVGLSVYDITFWLIGAHLGHRLSMSMLLRCLRGRKRTTSAKVPTFEVAGICGNRCDPDSLRRLCRSLMPRARCLDNLAGSWFRFSLGCPIAGTLLTPVR